MIEVSAGIIRRGDGKALICQRGAGRNNAHLWEFPGGKLEKGESPCACLQRELMEELTLPVENLQEVCQQEAQGILFHFIQGTTAAEPIPTEHEDHAFVSDRAMLRYPFCPADTQVARALALNDPPLRHFFWDFDGTVMDTYPGTVEVLLQVCGRMGIRVSAQRALDLMKDSLPWCIRTIAAEHGRDAEEIFAAFRDEEKNIPLGSVVPVRGMPEALSALPGKHYLVTHRDHMAITYLKYTGLYDRFTDFIIAEDGFPRKPQPDSLLHLLRKHGLDPAECVMIGDRPLDTAAGRNAGMLSCLLDEDGRFPDDPCELRTASAYELPALLCPEGVAKMR